MVHCAMKPLRGTLFRSPPCTIIGQLLLLEVCLKQGTSLDDNDSLGLRQERVALYKRGAIALMALLASDKF
jgi:hypothetical protein